jgi:hypothetical protein
VINYDAAGRTKAVRGALAGKWAPNRVKEVIGAVKARRKSKPSPFASVSNEGALKGVFAKLVEFDELVCSQVVRPCAKNFTPNIVVSFAFISFVYTAETMGGAQRIIDARVAAYKDRTKNQMPGMKRRCENTEEEEEGQEEEEEDAEEEEEEEEGEEGEEEEEEEEEEQHARARADFDAFLEDLRDKHGGDFVAQVVKEAAKKLRRKLPGEETL